MNGKPARCLVCGVEGGARTTRLVRDHCHHHDYVRGDLCDRCNHQMSYIDRGKLPSPAVVSLANLLRLHEHYARCPGCAREAA